MLTLVTPLFRYPDFDKRVAFVNAQLEQIRAIPGVVSAAAISRVPLTVNDQATFYRLPGQSIDDGATQVALSRVVTRDYFSTVRAQLRDGRFFDVSDQRSDAPSAIVNETFADRHFAGRSPLGAQIKFGNRGPKGYWYTIVGVVKEIRDRGVAEELRPTIYRVHEQADQSGDVPSGIVVRTARDEERCARAAVEEHRRDEREVGQVRAAVVGIVQEHGIPGLERRERQRRLDGARHGAEVHGDVRGLRHQPGVRVEHGARVVEPLGDVGRVRGAHERGAHLLGARREQAAVERERDRVGCGAPGGHRSGFLVSTIAPEA